MSGFSPIFLALAMLMVLLNLPIFPAERSRRALLVIFRRGKEALYVGAIDTPRLKPVDSRFGSLWLRPTEFWAVSTSAPCYGRIAHSPLPLIQGLHK